MRGRREGWVRGVKFVSFWVFLPRDILAGWQDSVCIVVARNARLSRTLSYHGLPFLSGQNRGRFEPVSRDCLV